MRFCFVSTKVLSLVQCAEDAGSGVAQSGPDRGVVVPKLVVALESAEVLWYSSRSRGESLYRFNSQPPSKRDAVRVRRRTHKCSRSRHRTRSPQVAAGPPRSVPARFLAGVARVGSSRPLRLESANVAVAQLTIHVRLDFEATQNREERTEDLWFVSFCPQETSDGVSKLTRVIWCRLKDGDARLVLPQGAELVEGRERVQALSRRCREQRPEAKQTSGGEEQRPLP